MNASRASKNGCIRYFVRLAGHLTLHKRLWKNFVTVIEHCFKVGATVFIEWPRECAYWKDLKKSAGVGKHRF
eukprot:6594999-Lingulodinium_polyedra.AAC.1